MFNEVVGCLRLPGDPAAWDGVGACHIGGVALPFRCSVDEQELSAFQRVRVTRVMERGCVATGADDGIVRLGSGKTGNARAEEGSLEVRFVGSVAGVEGGENGAVRGGGNQVRVADEGYLEGTFVDATYGEGGGEVVGREDEGRGDAGGMRGVPGKVVDWRERVGEVVAKEVVNERRRE